MLFQWAAAWFWFSFIQKMQLKHFERWKSIKILKSNNGILANSNFPNIRYTLLNTIGIFHHSPLRAFWTLYLSILEENVPCTSPHFMYCIVNLGWYYNCYFSNDFNDECILNRKKFSGSLNRFDSNMSKMWAAQIQTHTCRKSTFESKVAWHCVISIGREVQ